jgi:sensor histidine kinase YesM
MQMTVPPPTTGFPFRQLGRDAGYAAVLNVLCAVVITSVTRRPENFFENLVCSMCVGMIMLLIGDGARLALWGPNKRPRWPVFFVIIAAAVPFAQFFGIALAGLLLGHTVASATNAASKSMSSMLVFTLLAAGAAWLFFVSRDRILRTEAALAVEKARAETINRQALQTQLRLLQAQIEPHMLFNTLANLQGLIALDPARAQSMLDQLILYLRATLTSSRSEDTTLAHEFALLDAYLGLMSVRMGQRLGYTLDLPPSLAGVKLPPMLLQPLVENAIVHGIEPHIDGGHVTISAAQKEGMLELSIADTGRGLQAAPGQPGTGLGVSNTRERLVAVYGERAALSLTPNAPHGALARLTLPLQTP